VPDVTATKIEARAKAPGDGDSGCQAGARWSKRKKKLVIIGSELILPMGDSANEAVAYGSDR